MLHGDQSQLVAGAFILALQISSTEGMLNLLQAGVVAQSRLSALEPAALGHHREHEPSFLCAEGGAAPCASPVHLQTAREHAYACACCTSTPAWADGLPLYRTDNCMLPRQLLWCKVRQLQPVALAPV